MAFKIPYKEGMLFNISPLGFLVNRCITVLWFVKCLGYMDKRVVSRLSSDNVCVCVFIMYMYI